VTPVLPNPYDDFYNIFTTTRSILSRMEWRGYAQKKAELRSFKSLEETNVSLE
jgi:hypothetical protein